MNKLVYTKYNDRIVTGLFSDGKPVQLSFDSDDNVRIGSIYIGRVSKVAKNINAAFIDIGNGQNGYYSLTDNRTHIFTSSVKKGCVLHENDEIVVQVLKEPVKSKDCVLTSNLSFPGRYTVLTSGDNSLGFSTRIKDNEWKDRIKKSVTPLMKANFGIIIRTNAISASLEDIMDEILQLEEQYTNLIKNAMNRTCYTVLKKAEPSYIGNLRDMYTADLGEIITDIESVYNEIGKYINEYCKELSSKLRFYEDELLPLSKLYSINTVVERALSKNVWLNSGGYIVIEPTEAMVIIDVNTGKYDGKRKLEETILKINKEAAAEIAYQLRLRNLSGIIIIDFIDMKKKEDKEEILNLLKKEVRKDPVKTVVVDMTSLNLVELTRKKIKKPLYEAIK